MSVENEPIPPAPITVDITVKDKDGRFERFAPAWINWFNSLKVKAAVLNDNLAAIANLFGQGFAVRLSATQWIVRTITGTGDRITVANGNGLSGNPVVDIASTYVGQASITTLGTITTGTWNGSVIDITYGGTGANNASDARINLGATTVGSNIFTVPNPSAIRFLRVNADNTVSFLNAADFVTAIGAQPLDATLTALAGQNWVLNALPIGSGADMVSQVSFAANTFPARASAGNLVAKTITDDALLLLADADVPRLGTVNTWSLAQTFAVAPVFTDQSGTRTALALGTAAVKNTGTSGDAVPLLNAANTWSLAQTFPGLSMTSNMQITATDYRIFQAQQGGLDVSRTLILGGSSFTASSGSYMMVAGVNHATFPGEARLIAGTGADVLVGAAAGQAVRPSVDGAVNLGKGSFRWAEVFAANGTINTSDARLKTEVRPFTDAELAAALDLSDAVGFFQFLSAIDRKGVAAREHCGLTVQRAIEVMKSHSLDPFGYGFICHDRWDETAEVVEDHFEKYNKDGKGVGDPIRLVIREHQAAGDVYGFRPDQLDRFIAKGLRENQKRIEARLNALETK